MSPVEIMFALQGRAPFDSLTDGELEIAAAVTTERRFSAKALVLGPGEPFQRLLIQLDGTWLAQDEELPQVLGIESLLSGVEGPGEIRAGDDGVRCLVISRGHFFTLINECPALLLSLLTSADQPRSQRGFL